MLKTKWPIGSAVMVAYHLGEGRVLKTMATVLIPLLTAYHLGEGRVLKTKLGTLPGGY